MRTNFVNAELAKLALNMYVASKISFANVLAQMCEQGRVRYRVKLVCGCTWWEEYALGVTPSTGKRLRCFASHSDRRVAETTTLKAG